MNLQEHAALALNIRDVTAKRLARRDKDLMTNSSGLKEDRVGHVASTLSESSVLLWDQSVYKLATSGDEAFAGTVLAPEMCESYAPEFWVFRDFTATPPARELMKVSKDTNIYGVLFYLWAGRLHYIFFLADPALPDTPILRGYSAAVSSEISGPLASLMAAHEFTRMKIAAKEPVLLPRTERRRMQREGVTPSDIRIVQLRGREASIWHGVAERKYHHSWIVKGHWRRLHEPRKHDGAPTTWVESYVKGVGPLLPQRESVYAVTQ